MPFSFQYLQTLIQDKQPVERLWIAYSGGVDSHALLVRIHELRDQLPAIAGAIHIHHGISQNADQWQTHCQLICRELGIHLHSVNVQLTEGEGLEDQARAARYRAFEDRLGENDAILLAQHEDDQAETLLLQAIRGGGPRGLAAMPAVSRLGDGYLLRPMLNISKADILAYAQAQGLQWIEDESNEDVRFDRNFLRQKIFPLLKERWPSVSRTLARSAAHTADLVNFSEALWADELSNLAGQHPQTLSISSLLQLPQENAALYIKAMCRQLAVAMPATVHIKELLHKQLAASSDRQIKIKWPGGEFRRYENDLFIIPSQPETLNASWEYQWDGQRSLCIEELHGELRLQASTGSGIRADLFSDGVQVKPRSGGEKIKARGDAHHRELKAVYQYHHIPPWLRERMPLLYHRDTLIAVADIVIAEDACAAAGERGFEPVWTLL